MGVPNNADLKAKLRKLECPFTWDIEKHEIEDLDNTSEKLLDRVKFCPRKYHGTYLNILAFVSHMKGNNESALEFLHKAEATLKADKQVPTAFLVTYANFAWVHYQSGNLGDVGTYLCKLEEICKGVPGSSQYSCTLPVVHGEKAWTFLRLGAKYYKRAKVNFQKALEGDPENVSFNIGYGVVLYRLEHMVQDDRLRSEESRRSEAVTQLRKALLLDPANAEVMVLLALKLQQSEESCELIKDALRLSPDVPQVMRYVAKYFRAERSTDASLEVLGRALEQAPNSSFLHHQIGLCHKQQLIEMLKEEREYHIRSPLKGAKVKECVHDFSKAVELKPTNIYAQVNLAEAYGDNQQLYEAEKIFTELLKDGSLREADRQHVCTAYGLFLMYKKKAQDRAIAEFKSAYQIKIQSRDRKQAGAKLAQLGNRAGAASQIQAFLRAEDKRISETEDLSAAFDRGMKFK
ncbi:hypothetical protein AAFF_G00025830 [Aldrovandia affinis]|uniref:Interferon-induced protein with tetratricopeptide repeats 5-like n=1 Tax=Aldrovandia affinis TaxID=143900 RepID=A0AAD7S730_9TELE|nr:hypothetical protein AAFF_G00025830 [Aldrovandia affinis]